MIRFNPIRASNHHAPFTEVDIRMEPESCHHAQDPFAQGLGPYMEIPVQSFVYSWWRDFPLGAVFPPINVASRTKIVLVLFWQGNDFRYDAKRGAAMMMEKPALTSQDMHPQRSQEPSSLAI
jgi:hypothetical protein